MKSLKRLENYIYDKEYKIIIKEKSIDIINYDEIIEFSLSQIKLKYQDKSITISGKNLVITKMQDNEVLITGIIDQVRIN